MTIKDLIARHWAGEAVGLPSFCTANEDVLRAILSHAAANGLPALIEATCNQVNQNGGYTGMQPADFAGWVKGMAAEAGLAPDLLLLGGDHLGPNPWRAEPADAAMDKADALVRAYVEAGFTKIHLDASMACGGEPRPSFAEVSRRAARLCRVAEAHAPDPSALIYVIGTEVPVPGGETDDMSGICVTTPARLDETVATHRAAFREAGVDAAWPRVVSVVTQPGVDFSHSAVHRFDPAAAQDLVAAIDAHDGLTFEGHSTDYQPAEALAELVARHVFFLKVGPELTFRFREAVFALASIEDRLRPADASGIVAVLDAAMARAPQHWQGYYEGDADDIALMQHFSLSDRIRYYWTDPEVASALRKLLGNLAGVRIPAGLATQAFGGFEFGDVPGDAATLLRRHAARSVARYYQACGLGG